MKKNKGFKNTILLSIAVMFVAASNMIATSGSFILVGEPKCPKSLLR
ncbi:MAG: cyclic lactone autoinducer peptide [Epulopiscium sp.]|nr:cyclic lactone autoinducer peptide [Candidatus Epulonipiscium sp.]